MHIEQWWSLFLQQVAETDGLQWLAVSLGIAEVLFARVNKIWLYPTGIAGTLLYIYSIFHLHLYAECVLNAYYIVMSVYGWWHWIKKKNAPPVRISWCSRQEWIITVLIVIGGTGLFYGALKKIPPELLTPSNVPLWDAWVSATAWAGMWLLAKRKIENWIWLNISNLFAIPLLFYKGLPLFSALTVFLFMVAVWGFFDWIKRYRTDSQGPANQRSDHPQTQSA